MGSTRYRVHDGPLLKRLMHCPEPGGTPHTVRSLAKAVGLSRSKIQALVDEVRPTVEPDQADRIAKAVGVRRKALFSPPAFAFEDKDKPPRSS